MANERSLIALVGLFCAGNCGRIRGISLREMANEGSLGATLLYEFRILGGRFITLFLDIFFSFSKIELIELIEL